MKLDKTEWAIIGVFVLVMVLIWTRKKKTESSYKANAPATPVYTLCGECFKYLKANVFADPSTIGQPYVSRAFVGGRLNEFQKCITKTN